MDGAAAVPPRAGFRLALAASGGPVAAGSADDVYYIGARPRAAGFRVPAAYRFLGLDAAALKIDLQARYPGLREVRFPLLPDAADPASEPTLDALLRQRYGAKATLRRLGRGGQQVAVAVCRPDAPCIVAKVRRHGGSGPEAVRALRRDLVLFAVAEKVVARTRWADGKPWLRVVKLGGLGALQAGILEQELIRWQPSEELEQLLRGNVGHSGVTRDALWREAPAAGIARPRALAFADRYQKGADLGPELFRLRRFAEDCEALAALPTVKKVCALARRDFHLAADLPDRIAGVEQIYRDSAPLVLRLVRQHLGEASANPGADGAPREIGLDLNHGRNVGWDPGSAQFVIFDA